MALSDWCFYDATAAATAKRLALSDWSSHDATARCITSQTRSTSASDRVGDMGRDRMRDAEASEIGSGPVEYWANAGCWWHGIG